MTITDAKKELAYILSKQMTKREIRGHIRVYCDSNNITGIPRTKLLNWALSSYK